MTNYYASVMFRGDNGDLVQEYYTFCAKNKTEAKRKGKQIADSKKVRLIGVYLEKAQD